MSADPYHTSSGPYKQPPRPFRREAAPEHRFFYKVVWSVETRVCCSAQSSCSALLTALCTAGARDGHGAHARDWVRLRVFGLKSNLLCLLCLAPACGVESVAAGPRMRPMRHGHVSDEWAHLGQAAAGPPRSTYM